MSLEQTALRVYRTLIRAFPDEFREAHGAELADATEDVVRDTVRRYGRARLTFLIPRLLGDLLLQAAVEHWRDALRDSRHAIRLLARATGIHRGRGALPGPRYRPHGRNVCPGAIDHPGGASGWGSRSSIAHPHSEAGCLSSIRGAARRHGALRQARRLHCASAVTLETADHSERYRVWGDLATPDYFDVLGIQPARGRLFGQPVKLGNDTWQVVGVVRDTRSAFPLAPTLPAVYQPVTPAGFAAPSRNGVTFVVRAAPGLDAPTLLVSVVASVDARLTVVEVRRLSQDVEQALFLARAATFVYGGMGVLGLILASVGLAGVTAYAVARRTREIGIRMALGAQRSDVLWLVLREGAALVVAGTITGVLLALTLTRALSGVVEALAETTRTSVSDPRLLLGGPALLLVLALITCYLPARRSTRIDPILALRAE